jgi:hypothetical protein
MSLNSLKNKISKPITNMASKVMNKTKNIGAKINNGVKPIKDGLNPIKDGLNPIKNGLNPIKDGLDTIKNAAKEKIANVGKKVDGILPTGETQPQIPITKWGEMSIEFLNANTAISKFVSFILFLLIFVILFQIGAGLLQRFLGPKYNPYIINGMVSSDKTTKISSNPNISAAVPIYRSIDKTQGLEFTWNVWFFINSEITNNLFSGTVGPVNASHGYRIFSKGPSGDNGLNTSDTDKDSLNICPGLYLKRVNNDIQLNIILNTFVENTSITETLNFFEKITIDNIPSQKWICCTLRVQNKAVDVYINGMLKNRKNLLNLPKQNYYDTYIGDLNGFKGYISSLRYYSYAINYDEVQKLFASGPSLKMIADSSFPETSDFLSIKWFFT